nr:hypothetical protein [Tanacetum cinerariifolium]
GPEQPQFLSLGDRLSAALDPQFAVDMARVGFNGVQGDEKPLADFLIRATLGDELQHAEFAGAEGIVAVAGRRLADVARTWHVFADAGRQLTEQVLDESAHRAFEQLFTQPVRVLADQAQERQNRAAGRSLEGALKQALSLGSV